MKQCYDYIFITHIPSFYKVNLYNELSKKLNVFVIFVSSSSTQRTSDFTQKDTLFDHVILYDGNFESRPVISNIWKLIRLLLKLKFKRVVVNGWDLLEFWITVFMNKKKYNTLVLESTIAESRIKGLLYALKKIFILRISLAFPSGKLHQRLLIKLGFKGKYYMTKGVGLFMRTGGLKNEKKFDASFLYVGRLSPEKNIKLLIDIFNQNKDCRLSIVGNGPLKKELQKIAGPNIHFVSHVNHSEIAKVYLSHDVFLLPSISEPWGLVVEEALYYGLPVIVSSKAGCATEIINEGQTGFCFDPNDKHIFSLLIRKISNGDVFYRMKQNVNKIDMDKKDKYQVNVYINALQGF